MLKSSEIKEIHHTKTDGIYVIHWRLTLWCNYRCWYCPQSHSATYIPQEVMEDRAKKINKIIAQVPQDKQIEMHLIGGEVTFYDLIKILSYIDLKRLCRIHLITNFKQSNDYFVALSDFLYEKNPDLTFGINASFHDQYVDLKTYAEKILDLQERAKPNVKISLHLVVNNDLDIAEVRRLDAEEPKLRFTFVPQRGEDRKNIILDEEHQKLFDDLVIKNHAKQIIVTTDDGEKLYFTNSGTLLSAIDERTFLSTGYLCSAGLTTLRINEEGRVQRGQCLLSDDRNVLGYLDKDDEIILPTEPVECSLYKGEPMRCVLCPRVNVRKK